MEKKIFVLSMIVFSSVAGLRAQNPAPVQYADPMANISVDIARIAVSVNNLNERMKAFVDKFAGVGGFTLSEKQQRLIMGRLRFSCGLNSVSRRYKSFRSIWLKRKV